MTSRFKPLSPAEMTDAQRKAYEAIISGPRGGARGPFNALLRSPDLADRVQRVGEYVRFKSSLPQHLNELAILVVARHWTAQYEWYAHRELALKAGLDARIADAIAQGKRPSSMKEEEAAVYDFCRELHENKSVSDATYAKALEKFGERGVIDLIGASGYYTMVSMILNVDRHPLPEGVAPLSALK
jgi:4-carboxymuconolactone decarboxylase